VVGVSRTILTRDFRAKYGVSAGEYLRRVRLRWLLSELRKPDSNVKEAAAQAGYGSRKSVYAAFKRCTGLSLDDVRSLSEERVQPSMEAELSLRSPRPYYNLGRPGTRASSP
jgi:AraC-like DNA-binding protein